METGPACRFQNEEMESRYLSLNAVFSGFRPVVMDMCHRQAPPLNQSRPHIVARCFLYRDSEVMENPDVASAFAEKDVISDAVQGS